MNVKILYIGQDLKYWGKIQDRLKQRVSTVKFEFVNLFHTQEIQTLYGQIAEQYADLIFIDYEDKMPDFLHLSRLISRVNSTKLIPLIGLFEQGSENSLLKESILAGSSINHIKGGEIFNVIFDAILLTLEEQTEEHDFVTATLDDYAEFYFPAKVGKISPTGLLIEFNGLLKPGTTVSFEHFWLQNKIIPSKQMEVVSSHKGGQYYGFNYTYQLEFAFVDQLDEVRANDPEEVQDRKNHLSEVEQRFQRWLSQQENESEPKPTKTLIIDNKLDIYNQQQRTDKYPFILRAQPYFFNIEQEISFLEPHIIFVNLEKEPEKVETDKINDTHYRWPNSFEMLRYLVQVLSKVPEEKKPFVVVFNTENMLEGDDLADLKYNRMLSYQDPFKTEVMEKMVELFQSKSPELFVFDQEILYVNKSKVFSTVEFVDSLHFNKISETDCYFNAQYPIPMGSTIRVKFPIDLQLTIVPNKNAVTSKGEYYALINGIGEKDIKRLRQFVNSVFFREKEEARKKEQEDFAKLNKEKNKQNTDES